MPVRRAQTTVGLVDIIQKDGKKETPKKTINPKSRKPSIQRLYHRD